MENISHHDLRMSSQLKRCDELPAFRLTGQYDNEAIIKKLSIGRKNSMSLIKYDKYGNAPTAIKSVLSAWGEECYNDKVKARTVSGRKERLALSPVTVLAVLFGGTCVSAARDTVRRLFRGICFNRRTTADTGSADQPPWNNGRWSGAALDPVLLMTPDIGCRRQKLSVDRQRFRVLGNLTTARSPPRPRARRPIPASGGGIATKKAVSGSRPGNDRSPTPTPISRIS